MLRGSDARPRHTTPGLLTAVAAAAALLASAVPSPAAGAQQAPKPTVVLVHGAFADASGWRGVIERLGRRGYPVLAPANPLRGVTADAAYLRSFLATVRGPIVLAGHSYGGMVMSNAATGNPNVKALAYIAAYAPDQGDSIMSLSELGTDDMLGPATLTVRPFPAAGGTEQLEGYISPGVFRRLFAADLPRKQARAMAVSQRPAALATLGEPSGPPAWKTIPAWYLVAGRDNIVGTDVERAMAARMNPRRTMQVERASHVVMMSRPGATTRLILRAARAAG
jgi:pimeloyl-ACP methyl ester carboxylesterase